MPESREPPAALVDGDPTVILIRRLRIALVSSLGPIFLFAAADLELARDHLAAVWAIKGVALIVVAAALAALRRARGQQAVVTIALVAAACLYALSSASAITVRETATTPLLAIGIVVCTATLLPWGFLPQLAMVGLSAASIVVPVVASTGGLAAVVTYPNIGVAIGLGVSLYIARELELTRKAVAHHAGEQRRAEAQVRRLNAELEQRVADRTAQLEQVNRELQVEVAERRQAQAEISALIENVDHAIWSVDRSYHVIAFNPIMARRYERLFGAPLVEGTRLGELTPEAWRRWKGLYDRAFAGEHFNIEQEITTSDGPHWFSTSFNPIVADGTIIGITVLSADVTERRLAEERERRHQAELTHVLRLSTMGEMAAGIAHEINQPLAAIVNFARGCARRLRAATRDTEEIADAVDQIAVEALRAGEIIRRLRKLVRKEAPRQELVDLNAVVEEVLQLVHSETRQLAINVDLRLASPLPAVLADPIQIEQVVLNLVRNGIESMAESGAERRLAIASMSSGSSVELTVEDTGPGFADAPSDRIFDAFFTTKRHGLGMGLSISRTITEAHRGRLTAEPCSTGARFRLTLPIAARKDAGVAVQADTHSAREPLLEQTPSV